MVALVDKAQAGQRQQVVNHVDFSGVLGDDARQTAGGDDNGVAVEFGFEARDHGIDAAGRGEYDAGLHAFHCCAPNGAFGCFELDAGQPSRAFKKGLQRNLETGGDGAAQIDPVGGNGVNGRRGAKIDDNGRQAVLMHDADGVDDAVAAHFFGSCVADAQTGVGTVRDDKRLDAERLAAKRVEDVVERGDDRGDGNPRHLVGLEACKMHQAENGQRVLIGCACPIGADAPMSLQLRTLIHAEGDVGISYIDTKQHARSLRFLPKS